MADDDMLRRDFAAVMKSAAGGHVSDATWEALALGELSAGERHVLAAHISTCAECSDMYRTLRKLEDGARAFDSGVPNPSTVATASRSSWYAIAAGLLLVVAGGLLAWNLALRQENADLIARAIPPQSAPIASSGDRSLPPSISGTVNVPILDLQADALRGAEPGRPVASVAEDAPLATLILASDSRDTNTVYRLDVLNAAGQAVWESEALKMTPYNTFTLALSPRELGAGVFHLQLFRVNGDRREPLERYSLRVDPIR